MHAHAVAGLQSWRSTPSVSVLLPTVPGPSLAAADREHLDDLVARATARLQRDWPGPSGASIVDRLHDLVQLAAGQPTRHGLALFVNDDVAAWYPLGHRVRERLVIDETFLTRDLVAELQHVGWFRLLVIGDRRARLLRGNRHGWDGETTGVVDRVPDERDRAWARRIVECTVEHTAFDTLPLLVAGPPALLAHVAGRLTPRPLAHLEGSHDARSAGALHQLAWPVVEQHLEQQVDEALRRLDRAVHQRRAVTGIGEIWPLAEERRVDLVLVEQSFELPVVRDGRSVRPAHDPSAPGVIADAADDLIEQVLAAGGDALLVPDGRLQHHGPVAAVLRL